MDTKIIVKVPDELKRDVQEKAKSLGLSLSAYVRLILTQDLTKWKLEHKKNHTCVSEAGLFAFWSILDKIYFNIKKLGLLLNWFFVLIYEREGKLCR